MRTARIRHSCWTKHMPPASPYVFNPLWTSPKMESRALSFSNSPASMYSSHEKEGLTPTGLQLYVGDEALWFVLTHNDPECSCGISCKFGGCKEVVVGAEMLKTKGVEPTQSRGRKIQAPRHGFHMKTRLSLECSNYQFKILHPSSSLNLCNSSSVKILREEQEAEPVLWQL